ncbi:MAG: hypothetical protein K6U74_17335, partial [Firmicutes bacterium]|nr:hypothetical protein [Bacillota bacterium]
MASIIKKKIKGQIYYYAAESKRVDGKPRIVWQKYLGKVNDIVDAVSSAETLPEPAAAKVYSYGVEAALLSIAGRLGVRDAVNKHAGQAGAGLDAGEYILIHAINSCTNHGAKVAEWFTGTVLRRHFNIHPKTLTEKRFRELAEMLTEDVLEKIQAELAGRIHTEFGIGTRTLIYHDIKLPNTLAGKAPREPAAYPAIGLLVSSDFFVPLFYEPYHTDFTRSAPHNDATSKLIERYRRLGRPEQNITVVKNLCLNPDELSPEFGEILGPLPAGENQDLLEISPDRLHPLKEYRKNKVKVYRCSKKIAGRDAAILLVFSESEKARRLAEITSSLRQCTME